MGGVLKSGCAALAMTVLLSGCATDQDQTRAGATLLGGLTGAAVGFAAGGTRGAIIGGVGGLAAGYVVGDIVAERKMQYKTAGELIEAESAKAQNLTLTTTSESETLKTNLALLNKDISVLKGKQAKGKLAKGEMDAAIARIGTLKTENQTKLDAARKELDVHKELLASVQKDRQASTQETAYYKGKLDSLEKAILVRSEQVAMIQDHEAALISNNRFSGS